MPKKINDFMAIMQTGKTVKINIYGQIADSQNEYGYNDESLFGAVELKKELDLLDGVDNLEIFINSPGGSAFGGIAIYNMLKRFPAKKTVYIDGIAASAASIIAMAGDEIIMPAGSLLMIHKALTVAYGNSDELLKVADTLDRVDAQLLKIYEEKTGLDAEVIKDLVAKETYMGAEEALSLGFATASKPGEKVSASIEKEGIRINNVLCNSENTYKFEELKNKIETNVVKNVDKSEENNNNITIEGEKIAEEIQQFIKIFKEEE